MEKRTLIGLGFLAVLFILDRLLLGMESRGWIYWRRTKMRRSGGAGNAMQELQGFFQPGQKHIVEARREAHEEQDENGDGHPPERPRRR